MSYLDRCGAPVASALWEGVMRASVETISGGAA